MFGGDLPLPHGHLLGPGEGGVALDVLHVVLLQVPVVDPVETLDVRLPLLLHSSGGGGEAK